MEKVEKRRAFIINAFFYVLVFGIVYVILKYALGWFTPFIIGFVIAYLLKPLINLLEKRIPLNRRIIASIVVIFAYTAVGMLLWVLGSELFASAGSFVRNLPMIFRESIVPVVNKITEFLITTIEKLSPEMVDQITFVADKVMSELSSWLISLSSNLAGSIGNITSTLPRMLLTLIFSILSSIFITMDYKIISSFIMRQLPEKFRGYILDFKGYLINTAWKYFKAYMILMAVTFAELSIGLLILRVSNAIGIAALIAICDVMPLLGCGTVLIPWLIIELIKGNYALAIGLSILYVIIYIVRQILEPRIVGKQLGLHPLVTLVAMYLGLRLMGFWGMILFPVFTIILINFQNAGTIKLWNE